MRSGSPVFFTFSCEEIEDTLTGKELHEWLNREETTLNNHVDDTNITTSSTNTKTTTTTTTTTTTSTTTTTTTKTTLSTSDNTEPETQVCYKPNLYITTGLTDHDVSIIPILHDSVSVVSDTNFKIKKPRVSKRKAYCL